MMPAGERDVALLATDGSSGTERQALYRIHLAEGASRPLAPHDDLDHDDSAALTPPSPTRVADLDVRLVRRLCGNADAYQMFPNIRVVRGCCDEVCGAFHVSPDGSFGPHRDHALSIPALGESGDARAVRAIAGRWPDDVLIAMDYVGKGDDRDRLHVLHWDGARQRGLYRIHVPVPPDVTRSAP